MRKNFTLIYELLDEVMDYGVPQSTGTEALKTFVLNEPVVLSPSTMPRLLSFNKGPTGVFKSVLDTSRTDGGKRRDEIFVDVVERVTCTFNASGFIVSSQVSGWAEGEVGGETVATRFAVVGGEGDAHLQCQWLHRLVAGGWDGWEGGGSKRGKRSAGTKTFCRCGGEGNVHL